MGEGLISDPSFENSRKDKGGDFKNEGLTVEVNNLTPFSFNKEQIIEAVKVVLKGEGVSKKEVSVVLVKEDDIRRLNKEHLGRNYVTDVLSFPYNDEKLLGEMIICPEKVREGAKKEDFTKEFFQVIIHGVLHLLDYDHETSEEKRLMEERTTHYLNSLGL